jgi:bifunctional non-homologous end joining protein LigD
MSISGRLGPVAGMHHPAGPRLRRAPSGRQLAQEPAALPQEALPSALEPMLAIAGELPADADSYRYEVKWDGYRALARWDGQRITLASRNGIDFAPRFPEIAGLAAAGLPPLLLDGEIVAVDQEGRSDFSALQMHIAARPGIRSTRSVDPEHRTLRLMCFDLLHLDGRSTRDLPYAERRRRLELLHLDGRHWATPPAYADGTALLAQMARSGQEGVLAKRAASTYQSGRRSADWLKIKLEHSDDFVVVGSWSSGKHGMSSLLLGCYASSADARQRRPLRYCGKVGTGFSEDDRLRFATTLRRIEIADPPCSGDLPREEGVRWCQPLLVAQIRFTEWTREGHLRHPAFLGMRIDTAPTQVIHAPGLDR